MELKIGNKGNCILTTEHAASSYGQPVLAIDGVAYGCADEIPGSGVTAGQMIAKLHNSGAIKGDIVTQFIAPLCALRSSPQRARAANCQTEKIMKSYYLTHDAKMSPNGRSTGCDEASAICDEINKKLGDAGCTTEVDCIAEIERLPDGVATLYSIRVESIEITE